ncbi:MAG TPA: glycosyltransferase [Gemmatimonadales bacterium]|nr:glycosyltransferase [Gemmatimonadales bacterium]
MVSPEVTVVVVPRERFDRTRASLDRLYQTTRCPFDLVYIDGNSPPPVARYLAAEADRRGFALHRTKSYLAGNEARNIGLRYARTPYVAFIENDVLPEPGWLEALTDCAERTGAWIVGPIVHIGLGAERRIHGAGAAISIAESGGRRRLVYQARLANAPTAAAAGLTAHRTDLIKPYCMLARRGALDRIGPFDQSIRSIFEAADVALAVQAAGGTVHLEPRAVVTHTVPPPLPASSVPFFLLRWSVAWLRTSLERFAGKHRLPLDAPELHIEHNWRSYHRRRVLPAPLFALLRRHPFLYVAKAVDRAVFDLLLEQTVVRRLERRRADAGFPSS